MSAYAELHCLSDFSFQRGASSARELFERANDCGYRALAITDECSLAGIVRAYEASLDTHLPLIVGSEFQLDDGPRLVLLVESKVGYIALCRLITRARRASEKGRYRVQRADFADGLPGTLALWLPEREVQPEHGAWLQTCFGERAWLAVELHRDGDDEARLQQLVTLGEQLNLRCVASGDVHMHVRRRLPLQQTMTAIRHHLPLSEAGHVLFRNSERHLRRRAELQKLYPAALLQESVRIAERCQFHMQELHYEYPKELVPDGYTSMAWLAELVQRGIAWRWPNGVRADIQAKIDKELRLIEKKKYPAYFLTVHDIVREARSRDILCQGRGSAANSVVCFTLGVTDADPEKIELVVERFISEERNEPPDIDIDFEHERREEVIQYIYNKYGRERAALAATVICYRAKSAVRDVAKALGLPGEQIDKLSRILAWWDGESSLEERLREQGFDPAARLIRKIILLTAQLMDMPRHLSQHVGGFVIADAPLHELVPVENAAMPDRTIIQWDKDDLDRMQLLKIDCLALGMLTCIRKCFQMVQGLGGPQLDMASIPSGDDDTYTMIQRADTLGTFQIESRAQMAMLPRLRPACYYDLVIQVAIVRPGPIQGDMVHPYLRRRRGEEKVEYPSEALRPVLQHTLGVPLFQEQVMRLAMVAADYTAGEADQLRRAMAAWRRNGGMEKHRERLLAGMLKNNYSEAFALQIFEQIKGFGSYGFPESHAASFANIAYASCWLKCHYPAVYACALLNAQPMGFYSPSQIVQDLQRHGIRVQPVDVRHSDWDCTLDADPRSKGSYSLRLGFRQLRGCSEAVGKRIASARKQQAFTDVVDLCARAGLDRRHQDLLADAQALRGLAGHRHRALWLTAGVEAQLPLFGRNSPQEQQVSLPPPTALENLLADYAHSGLSLDAHPLSLLRKRLRAARYLDSRGLQQLPHESSVRIVGLVTQRQRPQTASGVTFITLEDEFGSINVVVWAQVAQAQRRAFLESRLMAIDGRWETVDGVSHLIARRLHDVSGMLAALDARSRDFH